MLVVTVPVPVPTCVITAGKRTAIVRTIVVTIFNNSFLIII